MNDSQGKRNTYFFESFIENENFGEREKVKYITMLEKLLCGAIITKYHEPWIFY
jgi:hypothetical protein